MKNLPRNYNSYALGIPQINIYKNSPKISFQNSLAESYQNTYKISSGILSGSSSGIIQKSTPRVFLSVNPRIFSGTFTATDSAFFSQCFLRQCSIGSIQNSPKGFFRIYFLVSFQDSFKKSSKIPLGIRLGIPTGFFVVINPISRETFLFSS